MTNCDNCGKDHDENTACDEQDVEDLMAQQNPEVMGVFYYDGGMTYTNPIHEAEREESKDAHETLSEVERARYEDNEMH